MSLFHILPFHSIWCHFFLLHLIKYTFKSCQVNNSLTKNTLVGINASLGSLLASFSTAAATTINGCSSCFSDGTSPSFPSSLLRPLTETNRKEEALKTISLYCQCFILIQKVTLCFNKTKGTLVHERELLVF